MSADNILHLPNSDEDIIKSHNVVKNFEEELVVLVHRAIDEGAYPSVIVGVLTTTNFQVMNMILESEDA